MRILGVGGGSTGVLQYQSDNDHLTGGYIDR